MQSPLNKAGVKVQVLHTGDGHSVGHQMILCRHQQAGGLLKTYAYFGDLIPTTHHLSLVHGMSYDLDRRLTADWKQTLLERAIEEDWYVYFDHEIESKYQGVKIKKGERPGHYSFVPQQV